MLYLMRWLIVWLNKINRGLGMRMISTLKRMSMVMKICKLGKIAHGGVIQMSLERWMVDGGWFTIEVEKLFRVGL